MNAFVIAFSFLTRIVLPYTPAYTPFEMGRSLLWYPIVGFLIGTILVLCSMAFSFFGFSPWVNAALLLAVWMVVTGALHWDGLADCADAWLAGGNKQKTLLILKDTHCGSAAIVTVGVVLLIQFAALQQVVEHKLVLALLLSPVLARTSALLLMLTTPYVREGGLGETLTQYLPRHYAIGILVLIAAIGVFLFKWHSIQLLLGLLVLYFLLRRLMLKRLEGITGDTIGALIVLSEVMVLLLG